MNERRDADRHVRWPLVRDRLQGQDRGRQEYGAGSTYVCGVIDIEALRDHRARAQWDNLLKDAKRGSGTVMLHVLIGEAAGVEEFRPRLPVLFITAPDELAPTRPDRLAWRSHGSGRVWTLISAAGAAATACAEMVCRETYRSKPIATDVS